MIVWISHILDIISKNLASSIHDISAGGLLVCLSEMCMSTKIGAKIKIPRNNLDKYKQAYLTANKAIVLGEKIGKSYFQRASVLERLVDFYGSDELDFCDRLIYDLSSEDYGMAYKNGVLNAKVYKNNLKELVTSVGDWFLIGEKFTKMSPDNNECLNIKGSDCYSFIKNREVNKK